jgi:hypothetical protein
MPVSFLGERVGIRSFTITLTFTDTGFITVKRSQHTIYSILTPSNQLAKVQVVVSQTFELRNRNLSFWAKVTECHVGGQNLYYSRSVNIKDHFVQELRESDKSQGNPV